MKTTTTFDESPSPNQRISSGESATVGVEFMAEIQGAEMLRAVRFTPIRRPPRIPTMLARPKPITNSSPLVIVCSCNSPVLISSIARTIITVGATRKSLSWMTHRATISHSRIPPITEAAAIAPWE